jgi:hypothetical protein
MKPPVIAVIACADSTWSVNYIFTEEKPEPIPRHPAAHAVRTLLIGTMYEMLESQARRDYGEDANCATMGCGICVSTADPLPAHLAIASCSTDFSLLRQGWRFHSGHCHAEPIPAAVLGELALAVRLSIAANPAWEMARGNCAANPADYMRLGDQTYPDVAISRIIEAARKLP